MKKFIVSFTRKAVYIEDGYLTVEASNASAAKRIATEILEDGKNPCDYDGDVTDISFDDTDKAPQIDADVKITEVEKDDFIDDEEGYNSYEDEDEDEDEDEFID